MNVFALDFDGVLCDSARETGVAGWRAGAQIWENWRGPEPPEEYLDRFVQLRPYLETGYQAILLLRLIADGRRVEEIAADFSKLCRRARRASGMSRDALVRLFGETRDQWIAQEPQDWLRRHRFYPGVIETVRSVLLRAPVFILTTKQERFVAALLGQEGVAIPDEHIFGLERKAPKEALLAALMRRPEFQRAQFHFVEDRLDTLLRIQAVPELGAVLLYLVDWGYTTREDLDRARELSRIQVIDAARFLAT